MVNVTATGSLGSGWLQVFPTGRAAVGSSSTLNLDFAGQTIPNAAFAPLGDGGKLSVYATFTTHLIVDVFGYFTLSGATDDGRFVAVAPTRILDTRTGLGVPPPANPGDSKNCGDFATWAAAQAWFDTYFPWYGDVARLDGDGNGIACESLPGAPDSSSGPPTRTTRRVLGGSTIRLQVAGRGGVPSSGVAAVAMNVTAVDPAASGWVQVAPTPINVGASSNLNPEAGRTIANLVVVPVGSGGQVDLYSTVELDLLADVVGYFTNSDAAESTDGLFVPITPQRLLDSRQPAPQPPLPAGATRSVSAGSIAPSASAITGNLTATAATGGGWVQLSPTPISIGAASNLNTSYDGQTIANAVVSPVAPGGGMQMYTYRPAHLLLDITGWFTGG